ncbi:hypothetical protein QE152_g25791 [Popillia japonica]|uniref:Ig-like domain-containing protein n=1 Tax=Popillia japonica TaxID=7064 RepID=A0AAW1K0U1_POPJA
MSVGLLPHGLTTIKCHVDAVPNSVRFSWTYNTSQGVLPVQGARIENKDDVSTLHFNPGTADIDSLSCWASNVVGRQEIPCLFHVVPANWPESPRNCILNNLTQGSLEVKCTAGADGGLEQKFILEVMDTTGVYNNPSGVTTLSDQAEHSTPLFRVLGHVPVFRLHSLRPRRDYQLVVYAQNAKGRSRPPVVLSNVRIEVSSDATSELGNDAEANLSGETGNVEEPMKQNLTLILLGLTASAVLLIVGIVSVATVLACRKQQSNSGNNAVVLRQRRSSKPPDDLELSEAGFGEGFHRRSAQYRASLYVQEMELGPNIRQTAGEREGGDYNRGKWGLAWSNTNEPLPGTSH